MKIKPKKIITFIVVILFAFSISSTINAFEKQKNIEKTNKTYLSEQQDLTNIQMNNEYALLNGKYAVMTERTDKPKTNYDIYSEPQPTASFDDLPPHFTWTNFNGDWTTSAKDQASCGSCWAFSAASIIEASINIASGYPDTDIDLSEQYILSCLPYGGSCNGGWTDDCLDSIISTSSYGNNINGIPLESCMPYQAVDYIPCDDKCENWDFVDLSPEGVLWELADWGANHNFDNDDPNDRDIVKSWLMDYGPLSASMYATSGFSSYWNSHHDPEDWYFEEDYPNTNHAVMLVGWKDDQSVTNGGFWRLKNSWGTDFGYNGFFNVAYGGLKIGDIIRWCTTPEWPQEEQGPGPEIDNPDMHVFADFSWDVDYPKLGDEIEFNDESVGQVVLREWDFDGDGVIDSDVKRPKYTYYEEGDYEATLTVWSTAGLNSTIQYIINVKEVWPPFAVATPEYYGGDDLTVTFEGRHSYDVDGSIASYHWDFDDGSTSTDGSVTHTFPEGDRIYNVVLTVTDNEGNQGTILCDIRIDFNIPPETILNIYGCTDINQWFKNKVKVELIAEDWTGVDYTRYRINGGDLQDYLQPFIISTEGEHTISFYSVDVYGNEEGIKSQKIKIDKTAPNLDVSISGTSQNGWYITPVDITLGGSDELSGLERIIYKLDLSNWQNYTNKLNLNDGEHRLWVFAVDNAGNNFGQEQPMIIRIDSNPPETHAILTGEGSNNNFYQSVILSFGASDLGSGIDATYYNLDNSGDVLFTDPVEITDSGTHTLNFYSIDNIGNKEESEVIIFTISEINFNMEITRPDNRLYFFGIELFKLETPLIIGAIDIKVDIDYITDHGEPVEYVEFFIDDESKIIDTDGPYEWVFDGNLFGRHTIKVIAFNSEGGNVEETIDATFFIFG